MRLTVVAVGKLRLPGAAAMQAEYVTRLSRFGRCEVVEVAASKHRELPKRLEQEGKALLKALPKGALVVLLDREGKAVTSEGLASWIQARQTAGEGQLAFVIGGSDGVSEDVRRSARAAFSFSKLTFPHQLFRVMLLEQLYRTASILQGSPYHK